MSFDKLAQAVARSAGRPLTFIVAVALVIVWGVSGPIFGFSDTWQLVINTGTTIITFLMVFLIQNTQNRDTDALQVKIDELLRVTEGARLALLNLEEMKADELERIKDDFITLGRRSKGRADDPSRSSTAEA
jgi:low affinity Fe/Cu permease